MVFKTVILNFFGLAGGGGSSSGGGGGGGSSSSHSSHSSSSSSSSSSSGGSLGFFETIFILAVWTGIIIFVIKTSGKGSVNRGDYFIDHNKTEKSKEAHKRAEEIFYSYQKDWSEFNIENIKNYTTESYFEHAKLMLEALKDAGRKNVVSKVKIITTTLDKEIPDEVTEPINCRIKVTFSANDEVVEVKTGKSLFSKDYHGINETWNFVHDGKELRLSGISQPTESSEHLYQNMAKFAHESGLFYSPDWGRYCLPDKGLIFDPTSLYTADVNNHIIGKWGETLVQLYTYAPVPGKTPSSYYVVGQLNVPKEYLGIIVKSKKFRVKKPSDYDKFELEWNDFNNRYEVFASSKDALPAFELLEPKFMADLYDRNLNYNIEVIGNAIYIFAPVRKAKEDDYHELFDILVEAYKRLKK